MKHLKLLLASLVFSFLSFANPINLVQVNNGKWSESGTWSLGRLPMNEDTVIIPAGATLLIDNNVNLPASAIFVEIYGTLELKVGKLTLNGSSIITVHSGGIITSIHGNSSEKLIIGGTLKYSGSDPDITGPAYASASTGSSPNGFESLINSVLPVTFAEFEIARHQDHVNIRWTTSQEVNALSFDIEKSTDGRNFITIGSVMAAGNSSVLTNYSYNDMTKTAGMVYYRIRQTDIDGRFIYTHVKSLRTERAGIGIAGSVNGIRLSFSEPVKGKVNVQIVNLNGQVMNRQVLTNPEGQVILPLMLKGNYIVSLVSANGSVSKQVLL